MGQILQKLHQSQGHVENHAVIPAFPDLSRLPPELSLAILSHLNATDLCLAACVWKQLGNDEILWQSLCRNSWGCASIYQHTKFHPDFSYRKLYLMLDEATLTFNGDPFEGEAYLIRNCLVDNRPMELAKFIHTASRLRAEPVKIYLEKRREVLDCVIQLQNFQNQFLPNALRKFFCKVSAPSERGSYLEQIIDRFSERFVNCNPQLGLHKDVVFVLCYSLIMLSVDLCSPAVKNKMSKREFIKNTQRATLGVDEDLAGHLYDNIYLIGHVAVSVS